MKFLKLCIILFLICYSTSGLFSQENVLRPKSPAKSIDTYEASTYKIRVGLEAGVNYNMFSQDITWLSEIPNSIFNVFSSASGISPYFAAVLDFPIQPKLGFQLRAAYDGRNYSNTYTGIVDCNMEGIIVDAPVESKITITGADLSVSALLRYDITNEFVVTAGPMFLSSLGKYQQETILTSIGDECFFDYPFDPKKQVTSTEEIENINSRFGIDLGLAYMIEVSEGVYLAPTVRFNYVFSNITDTQDEIDATRENTIGSSPITSTNAKLHALKFGIGIWF